MNILPISEKTFRKYEEIVHKWLIETAADKMKMATKEEASHTTELGEVDKNGTLLITVSADGRWYKRSYRTNYSSLSEVVRAVL